jgi:predicted metal-dependent enzyme (double-stranded beta helix superfamily)
MEGMPARAFSDFTRDAVALIDDPHAIASRLAPLLREEGWLPPEHQEGSRDGYRQHLLHVSECRRLSVVALVWLPGQRTPIHDHVSWCVVGVYRGLERETHYRCSCPSAMWRPAQATSRRSSRRRRTSTR